jgi:hypothetical protein
MRRVLGWGFWSILTGCSGAPVAPQAPMTTEPLPRGPPSPPVADDASQRSAPAPPQWAQPLSSAATAALAASVDTFYRNAATLECDFAVEQYLKARAKRTAWQTHASFVVPGRFDATLSDGGVVVAGGSVLAAYDPVARQWFAASVAPDFVPIALGHFAGNGSLTRRLGFVAYPGAAMNAPSLEILVGSPKVSSATLSKLLLYADSSGEVRRTLILAPNGDRQRWDVLSCSKPASTALSVSSPTRSAGTVAALSSAGKAFQDQIAPLTTALP